MLNEMRCWLIFDEIATWFRADLFPLPGR